MITKLFLDFVYVIMFWLTYPIRSLSDASLPTGVDSAFTSAGHYLGNMQQVFPLSTLFLTLGSLLAVEGAILLWKGFQWILKKIPTIN